MWKRVSVHGGMSVEITGFNLEAQRYIWGKLWCSSLTGTWIRVMTAWDRWKRVFFSIFRSYEVFLYGVWGIQLVLFFNVTCVRLALIFFLVYN